MTDWEVRHLTAPTKALLDSAPVGGIAEHWWELARLASGIGGFPSSATTMEPVAPTPSHVDSIVCVMPTACEP